MWVSVGRLVLSTVAEGLVCVGLGREFRQAVGPGVAFGKQTMAADAAEVESASKQ